VDLLLLHQLWHSGVPAEEIGRHLGVSKHAVFKAVERHKLGRRPKTYTPRTDDPTPDQIAERAAHCRRMREAGTPIGGV
jgi:hypothetical protein